MARKFKVLKTGIYQRLEDGSTSQPGIDDIIEMSDIAADTHLIPEGYVEEVFPAGSPVATFPEVVTEEAPATEEASDEEVDRG